MNKILEDRFTIDEKIETYEELLKKLRKEKEKLIEECNHELRIINNEENEEFCGVVTLKEFCLFCGKQFNRTRIIIPWNVGNIIQMIKYPGLNKKWGKNYRKEVEKICLTIKKENPLCSEKELCSMLNEKLEELEEYYA